MGSLLLACATFLLGTYLSYTRGWDDGFSFGERHAEDPDIADIRWSLTAPLPLAKEAAAEAPAPDRSVRSV